MPITYGDHIITNGDQYQIMGYRFAVEPEVDNLVRGPVVIKNLFSVTWKIGYKFLRGSDYKVNGNQSLVEKQNHGGE